SSGRSGSPWHRGCSALFVSFKCDQTKCTGTTADRNLTGSIPPAGHPLDRCLTHLTPWGRMLHSHHRRAERDNMSLTHSDRIVVTGGAGFLGSFVVEKLRQRGYTHLIIPRRREYDLTRETDVDRLYADHKPDVVLHL